MSLNLLLAPAGAGKTETAIDRIIDLKRNDWSAQVRVLVSGERQISAFRQRLLDYLPDPQVLFNIEFFNFYSLYERLLEQVGEPQRGLDETARYRLLRLILAEMQQRAELDLYAGIAQTPGFVRIVAELIFELKQNVIAPDTYSNAVRTEKDRELAHIYQTYQNLLTTHSIVDREGEGWLALAKLRDHDWLGQKVGLFVVDGYDQFTRLQAQLIVWLASRAQDTLVTLTTVPGRAETIGRRFQRAYDTLVTEADEIKLPVNIESVPPPINSAVDRAPALQHLLDTIFVPQTEPLPGDDVVAFVETPDPALEVAAVLRQVKRLLVTGEPPDSILVALRDWSRYVDHFAPLAREFGDLPLTLHYGEPLNDNPAVAALLNLLALPENDFRRRDLMDVLQAPYFDIIGLGADSVALLDSVSRAYMVTGGRDNWLQAVSLAAGKRANNDGDELEDESPVLLDENHAEVLVARLTDFFDAITPPERGTMAQYVRWLEDLIGHDPQRHPDDENAPEIIAYSTNMVANARQSGSAPDPIPDIITARDLAALQMLKKVLRGLLASAALIASLDDAGADRIIDRAAFLADLRATIASATTEQMPSRQGRVLVTSVSNARGLPHSHVFVLGLSEGIFPQKQREDELYLDSERERLRADGVLLPLVREKAADDGLFFELVSLARETLTLSRPYIDNGDPWSPSHLWRAAAACFADADAHIAQKRVRIGGGVPADQVASLREVMVAVSAGLDLPEADPTVGAAYNWLLTHDANLWAQVRLGRQIERGRLLNRTFDRYSGQLSHPDLIAAAARNFSPDHLWSATQLNDYGMCGFRYFARRLLKLQTLEDPEEGMTALHQGSLFHEILDDTYRRIRDERILIAEQNTDRALEILHEVADESLADAPRRIGFRQPALWEHEQAIIRRRLAATVSADFDNNGALAKRYGVGRAPYRMEEGFGKGGIMRLDIGEQDPLLVRGKIDRIDRLGDKAYLVIDYKSGSTRITPDEVKRGRNFQMMLYLLAAANLFDGYDNVVGGAFVRVGSGGIIGDLAFDEKGNDAIMSGKKHLRTYLERGRTGDFAVKPNKIEDGKCSRFCEYYQLCRLRRGG